jgi:hypothetical protein
MLRLLLLKNFFSQSTIPVVDVSNFLEHSGNYTYDCTIVSEALHKYGCLIIKDPRVDSEQNNKFLDLMEQYFYKRANDFYAGKPIPDIYPETHFSLGATP